MVGYLLDRVTASPVAAFDSETILGQFELRTRPEAPRWRQYPFLLASRGTGYGLTQRKGFRTGTLWVSYSAVFRAERKHLMSRVSHGEVLTAAQSDLAAQPQAPRVAQFGFLLPELQKSDDALLPVSRKTRDALIRLGSTMSEPGIDTAFDSAIPSAYTYFGQFVDHDITLEATSDKLVSLSDPELAPLPLTTILGKLRNRRSPDLDLDSLYHEPAPRDCSRMVVGKVTPFKNRPPAKDLFNDLPRLPRSSVPATDREALIGDARNDENLITAQLQVAFLRAHNAIVERGHTFHESRKILRQHYQWVVINDFLNRIADPEIVNETLSHGNRLFAPPADCMFMPLEFSAAAYRFGHSMIRSSYDYNVNFTGKTAATLADLFTFTAFSGRLKDFDTLPENWIIEWENFLDEGKNVARRIDTRLVEPLFHLVELGKPMPDEARLAVRNLLRGYLLRIPTGQAVARALNLPVLPAHEIEAVAASVSKDQLEAVREAGFSKRTPLWYYVLAESAAGLSDVLGPVGSTIVAEVLIGLVRGSVDSIFREPGWHPSLGRVPGRFVLRDLLQLAGEL
jgi:hypothetical protein